MKGRFLKGKFLAVLICSAAAVCAQQRPIQAVHHTAWTSENGIGAVYDIQQAPSGYLWLTTSRGVIRFDGVRFESIDEVTHNAVRNDDIYLTYVAPDGAVWLTTRRAGLLRWKDEHITDFPDRRCTPALKMDGIVQDQEGSLWVQQAAALYRLRGRVCEEIGKSFGYEGGLAKAVFLDREGTLWVKTKQGQLLFLPPHETHFRVNPHGNNITLQQAVIRQAPDGSIWLADDAGLRRVTDKPNAPAFPDVAVDPKKRFDAGDFLFARDGSLWRITRNGLQRFEHPEQWKSLQDELRAPGEVFTPKEGLSSQTAVKILQGREGTFWIATNAGFDRIRPTAITAFTPPNAGEHDFSITAGDNGSVWTGNASLPLTQVFPDGTMKSFPQTVRSITVRRDQHGGIWSGGGGQFWHLSNGKLEKLHFPDEAAGSIMSIAVDRNGDTWISATGPEIYRFFKGQWIPQAKILGRKPSVVGTLTSDAQSNIWFAFSTKLVKWDGEKFTRYEFPDGPLNISVTTMMVRGDRVWMAGTGGVLLFTKGQFHLVHWKEADLPGRISGIIESSSGDLWLNGFSGVTHVAAAELQRWLRDPSSLIVGERLNSLDGLPGFSAERLPEPSIAESTDGRIWVATAKGIARIDPKVLAEIRNKVPPPVVIASIIANGKTYSGSQALSLPPHTESLQINYTALSLAAPERVFFRYKFDGIDNGWQDAGTRREAFYNNLPPGHYWFRLIACNNDGVWNEAGTELSIYLAPAFYQTQWFFALSCAAVAALLWWLIRLRIHNVTVRMQERLAERLAERERIARELHDTLLQSLVGLMLRFQAAADRMPSDAPVRMELEEALNRSDAVMQEGRDRVRNLRAARTTSASLSEGLADLGHEYQDLHPAEFRITEVGISRPLAPLVQEEIHLTVREALSNAFRHADASRIEVEITYGFTRLLVIVRDNGHGIPAEILHAGGREGHWGLRGMRERVQKIRGRLTIERRREGGTEVRLQVPASVAYQSRLTGRFWTLMRRSGLQSSHLPME